MYNEGLKAFSTTTDVEAHRLVGMSGTGNVSHNSATATNIVIGCSQYKTAAGDTASIKLINYPGTFELCAAGAIPRGDAVYAAASGKIQALPAAAGDYRRIGTALEEATADGDIIEVLPDDHITVTSV